MSKVYYCSSIWCNTSEENIKKIQLIQNYAAGVIVGNVGKYNHVSPLLKELDWLPIKEHLQYRDAILVHNYMYNQAPSNLNSLRLKTFRREYIIYILILATSNHVTILV